MRASVRVREVWRCTYSTLRTPLNASLTALSKQDPTLPMGWTTPSFRQARLNRREQYSLSLSVCMITPRTSPPRVAAAMFRDATTRSASCRSAIA
ncbi:hypothetical protein GCM10010421_50900 [Streptomyces glaucus]|uniref:Secreted protein n=1 Tax=Streptomyces glaucus TaxID=284029 RepID=A0ABP5XCA6_9ACTN